MEVRGDSAIQNGEPVECISYFCTKTEIEHLNSMVMILNLTLHLHNITEYDYIELKSYIFLYIMPYCVSKAN